jgi:hypothetical protein
LGLRIGAAGDHLEDAGQARAVNGDHPAVEKDAGFRIAVPLNGYKAQFCWFSAGIVALRARSVCYD